MKKIIFYYILMILFLISCLFINNIVISIIISCIGMYFAWFIKKTIDKSKIDIKEEYIHLAYYAVIIGFVSFILSSIILLIYYSNALQMTMQDENLLKILGSNTSSLMNNINYYQNILNVVFVFIIIITPTIKIVRKLTVAKKVIKITRLLKYKIKKIMIIQHDIKLSNGVIFQKNNKIQILEVENNLIELNYIANNNEQKFLLKSNLLDMESIYRGIP